MSDWLIDIYYGPIGPSGERYFDSFRISARHARSAMTKALLECRRRNIHPVEICCSSPEFDELGYPLSPLDR